MNGDMNGSKNGSRIGNKPGREWKPVSGNRERSDKDWKELMATPCEKSKRPNPNREDGDETMLEMQNDN